MVKYIQLNKKVNTMKYLLSTTLLLVSTHAFAIFCPTNFSQISEGYTIDQVIQTCGNPISQKTYKQTKSLSAEWNYYVQTGFNQPTSKMTVVLQNNQVINISIQGDNNPVVYQSGTAQNQATVNVYNKSETRSVASTAVCGTIISLGSTSEQVQAACGSPVIVNQNVDNTSSIDITELVYGGPNAATLIFENGIFTNRK
jgi:outer membrane protein assembly factor BamE (lipoprotein component of BamABCDE complex)